MIVISFGIGIANLEKEIFLEINSKKKWNMFYIWILSIYIVGKSYRHPGFHKVSWLATVRNNK